MDPQTYLVEAIRHSAVALDDPGALDALAAQLAPFRLVLLGEASHGTEDFYRVRRELTERLIEHHGFSGVVGEADWPDALAVTRFAHGRGAPSAERALDVFERFPTWMWRNTQLRALADWLRGFNARTGRGVGFYGMDLYSLHGSMREVIAYLEREDPAAAERARSRYGCFDRFGDDAQRYGRETAYAEESCEGQVLEQLLALQRRRAEPLRLTDSDEAFYAEQNARLVKNAEAYYRSMFHGRASSWNLRDTHMADTVDALLSHLAARNPSPKLVLWAHNSHLGDARATDMARWGELNVGQLLRDRHPGQTALVGLTTYEGSVTAAHDWDEFAQRMAVRPALTGSVEALLHEVGVPRFWLDLREPGEALGALREPRLERFMGVIYRPATERQSHYFHARLAEQFDFLIHLDRTRALQPLATEPMWHHDEAPDTYPTGL